MSLQHQKQKANFKITQQEQPEYLPITPPSIIDTDDDRDRSGILANR